MKKQLLFSFILFAFGFTQLVAQTKEKSRINNNKNYFDEAAATAQAKAKGLKPSEIKGYVQYLKNDFSSKKALDKQTHKHSPYEVGSTDINETVIYLEPNKPMSIGCPNMGFEQYNFSGWTGGIGTTVTGPVGSNPSYSSTGTTIINSAGNDVSVFNTTNYHSIMTLPPTSPLFPNVPIQGYDTMAAKLYTGQLYSQIPTRSPFSFDPVSVRMNSANANNRACKLKYITTSSPTNQRLSFSYAVVLQNPSGHATEESPYFKVEVRNEGTGTILPGCTSYTFNPKTSLPSDSLLVSDITGFFDPINYRKWQYYSVDLSTLPAGTNVSINFEVGGCTLGGHWGYAYVDAECGGIGIPYANMCSGSTMATLIAPTGFNSYQWTGPSGIISAPAGTNDTLIVNPANVGDTYTISMISPGGCTITQTVSIALTTVNIINLNSTSSCAGGASGSAYVQASGSDGVYTYTWTNTTTGAVVGNSQIATGLPPGTYSVLVASASCGQASANLSVGVSPPFFIAQNKPFCGNSTFIAVGGGSNYTWYNGSTPLTSTNDTLYITSAAAGDVYSLVYTNASGCRDSIAYTLNQIAGGSVAITNIQNVCPSSTNGSAVINLNTSFPPNYSYLVTGAGSSVIVNNPSSASNTLTVTALAAGTYTSVVNDGVCIYNDVFSISTIQTNFTITPTNTVLCFPTDTAKLNLDFGNVAPSVCGVDPTLCSGGSPTTLFAAGTFTQNGSTDYPTPFGNWYTFGRSQYLIRKSDLNAAGISAGRISSLAFNILGLNTSTLIYPNYSIKMGCTNLNALPNASSSSQPFIAGLQTVYSTASQPVSLGWLTHNFSQSYIWDGVSNIIIEVCFSENMPSTYTQNVSVELKQMSYVANMYHVEDALAVCSGTQAADNGFGIPMTNGVNMLPNMKFGYCAYSAPPANYTVSISSNGTIAHNYGNDSIRVVPTFTAPPVPNAPTIYTLTAINPDGLCTTTQTVAILYPSLNTSITATPTSTTICEGSNVNLSSSGAANYNWTYMQGATPVPIATTASVNVTPPAIGTNTYIVIGSSNCPSSTPDTKTITVNVTPIANLIITPIPDVTKCLNQPFVLTTGVGSIPTNTTGASYSYLWTTLPLGSSAPGVNTASNYTVTSNSTTSLVVTVSGVCARSTSDTVVVKNYVDNLAISIIDTSTTCANTPFKLNSVTTGGYPNYNYSWFITPNPSSISNTSNLSYVSPSSQGIYTVQVTVSDSCGYQKTDYEIITVLPPCSVIIPNVITPNGDGHNDYFVIKNIEYHPNTNVTIFDRWGLKVFESTNYNNDWKAEGVSDGTFFYVIDVPDDKKYSGFITVFKSR